MSRHAIKKMYQRVKMTWRQDPSRVTLDELLTLQLLLAEQENPTGVQLPSARMLEIQNWITQLKDPDAYLGAYNLLHFSSQAQQYVKEQLSIQQEALKTAEKEANLNFDQGDYHEAIVQYENLLKSYAVLPAPNGKKMGDIYWNIGMCYLKLSPTTHDPMIVAYLHGRAISHVENAQLHYTDKASLNACRAQLELMGVMTERAAFSNSNG